ncbi:MAG TPA: hypothetical protein VGM88_13460 [Kofleriaceae bacterium]|jgi:hypothetical protein
MSTALEPRTADAQAPDAPGAAAAATAGKQTLPQQPDGNVPAGAAPGALSEDQRNAARANTVDDLYMEQIAHTIAYQGAGQGQTSAQLFGPKGHRTPLGDAFEKKGFDIDNIRCVVGAASFKMWSLPARPDSKVTPVVAFCGTQDAKDVSDDANPAGIGMGQFTRNQALIQAELQRIGAGKGVTATGHSLGGSLAQIAACFYSNLIVNVVTFSAPGISKDVLAKLKDKGAGDVSAHHFRVADDLVDDAGEAFIPGQTTLYGKTGQLNPVDAHNSYPVLSAADHAKDPEVQKWMQDAAGTRDVPKLGEKKQVDSSPDKLGRSLSGVIEPIRKHASGIGNWASGVIGGAIGFLGGGTKGAEEGAKQARGKVGTPEMQLDEAYTKIWMNLLPQLDSGALTPSLIKLLVTDQCKQAKIPDQVTPMLANVNSMYPEYPAMAAASANPSSMTDVATFLAAVQKTAPLSAAAQARVTKLFPRIKAEVH